MSKFCKSPTETFKVILLAAGSDGDIHPHLGLGRELLTRGHEVIFLTTSEYTEMARECGFEAMIAMGPEDGEEFDHAERLNAISKIKARSRFFSRKVAEICDMAASQLDRRSILVAPPFGFTAAKLLHLRHGVPYVSTVLSPASL
jgi:rhamnosyltransferase subunit B